MKLTGNKILITGGSGGIGLGLAKKFSSEGNEVIICGKNRDKLVRTAFDNPSWVTYICDLAVEEERVKFVKQLEGEEGDINVLVNNAGIQNWMHPMDDDFYLCAKEEIEINVVATVHLTWLMRNFKSLNTIINISSGTAFVSVSRAPVYCATKAFVHSYTTALRYSLMEKGIEVIDIIPPALNTDLGGVGVHKGQLPVERFVESVFAQLKEGKSEITFGSTVHVVKATPDEIRAMNKEINGRRD